MRGSGRFEGGSLMSIRESCCRVDDAAGGREALPGEGHPVSMESETGQACMLFRSKDLPIMRPKTLITAHSDAPLNI